MTIIIKKLLSSWKKFKYYLKHNSKKMWVKDLILRLRIEEDNKLSKWRANFSNIVPKANFMKQVVKFLNKMLNKKGKSIVKTFNGKCFICNKTRNPSKGCWIRAQQINTRNDIIIKVNINEVDHLANEILKINMFIVIYEVNLIKNLV
jgi:hypothetical protein